LRAVCHRASGSIVETDLVALISDQGPIIGALDPLFQ